MTETVKAFSQHDPQFFPLPHPSWRSGIWMQRKPVVRRNDSSRTEECCAKSGLIPVLALVARYSHRAVAVA